MSSSVERCFRTALCCFLTVVSFSVAVADRREAAAPRCASALSRGDFPFAYKALVLQPQYRGEFEGRSEELGTRVVRKLSTAELRRYQVTVEKGLIVRKGRRVTAGNMDESIFGLVVMNQKREIFIVPDRIDENFYHSSLSGGEDVLFAGKIVVRRGKLLMVSDQSGHYRPPSANLIYFIYFLSQAGVSLADCELQLRFASFSRRERAYLKKLGIDGSRLIENTFGNMNHFLDPRFL